MDNLGYRRIVSERIVAFGLGGDLSLLSFVVDGGSPSFRCCFPVRAGILSIQQAFRSA